MTSHLVGLGRVHPFWVVVTIVGVGAFALAQPLLDLLGRNPEFFIARRFPSPDIVLLALSLMVAPALLALPVLALRLLGPVPAAVGHLVVLAFEVAVAAATILTAAGFNRWPPMVFFGVAAMAGAGLAWLTLRFLPVRSGLRYLGLAPVVCGAWFLFATPVAGVVFASPAELPETGSVREPVPVVVIVFDEFPSASLIHADGSLDIEHYPNFARLAADGVWYRNAVGVRQQTEEALPSILTGVGVGEGSIPTISDHPLNLFTMLSETYDVAAVENVTELCPTYVCENESRPLATVEERWQAVGSDLGVVYGHLLLPEALSASLPPIDEGWVGFDDQQRPEDFDIIERFLENVADDRRRELDRFLDTFDAIDDEPPLRFAHFLYPHHPWDLTGEGRIHGAPRPPGRQSVGWGNDDFLVAQGWQRHLIQVQWADTMVGAVLDRMEADGLYEDALVMVLADHGITIAPGTEHQRVVTPETVGSVAFVPFFVKYPADLEGAPPAGTIDDARAETIDVVPTVADVVGIQVPWAVEGVSLLDDATRRQRQESVMLGTKGPVEIRAGTSELREVASAKERWFPDGDPYRLAPPGWRPLLDTTVEGGADHPDVSIRIDQREELAAYEPGSDFVPSYLSGSLNLADGASGDEILAITVDGTVAAVTRTYEPVGDTAQWEAMIHPDLLDSGTASVEAWLMSGNPDSPAFRR